MAQDPEPVTTEDVSALEGQPEQGTGETLLNSSAPEPAAPDSPAPTISKLLRGKETEWEAIKKKTGPLNLLDLPVDVLRLVVNELTYSNDLTALALANSTLYNLAVPRIYAAFDIVWPDHIPAAVTIPSRVDALTYGLSTFCLGSKFAQRSRWLHGPAGASIGLPRRVIDNQYAKFTRKFGISNGPRQWIDDYMITKEGGKMLGTLVALAVAKMTNLETFVWDMPTGVLSDVFMSLASAQDHHPAGETTLQTVRIRCHDHRETGGTSSSSSSPAQSAHIIAPGADTAASNNEQAARFADMEYEYPTFSVLPPLKRLAVLDIDLIHILDELALLVHRSQDTLRELRLGVASKSLSLGNDFALAWNDPGLQQTDHDATWPGENRLGDKRLGGPLGVVLSRVYDIRSPTPPKVQSVGTEPYGVPSAPSGTNAVSASSSAVPSQPGATIEKPNLDPSVDPTGSDAAVQREAPQAVRKRLTGRLRLETLELENISLHVPLCIKAFDWSILTSLTIFACPHWEDFWRGLRDHFQPTPPPRGSPPNTPPRYHLALKNIHTDCVSEDFIAFVKDTLEPNSLEALMIQMLVEPGLMVVPIEKLFNGVIKRHRRSLKKLLVNSTDWGRHSPSQRWRCWIMTTDMISYLTSGRMKSLRELSIAVDLRDWHLFLQRLPNIPELRSLHIHHAKRRNMDCDAMQMALQAADVVSLRPDIKLCFVAVDDKCYEITEEGPLSDDHYRQLETGVSANGATFVWETTDSSTNSSDDEDNNNEDEHSNAAGVDDDGAEVSGDADSDAESFSRGVNQDKSVRLQMREILFYDKIDIFRAKNGHI